MIFVALKRRVRVHGKNTNDIQCDLCCPVLMATSIYPNSLNGKTALSLDSKIHPKMQVLDVTCTYISSLYLLPQNYTPCIKLTFLFKKKKKKKEEKSMKANFKASSKQNHLIHYRSEYRPLQNPLWDISMPTGNNSCVKMMTFLRNIEMYFV